MVAHHRFRVGRIARGDRVQERLVLEPGHLRLTVRTEVEPDVWRDTLTEPVDQISGSRAPGGAADVLMKLVVSLDPYSGRAGTRSL